MDPITVLFDEDCGLCRWSASKLRTRDTDGGLRFVGIRSETGSTILRTMDLETRLASWHVAAENGAVWSGGAAIPVVARRLRGGAPVAWLTETFPEITERLYRWIAAHRLVLARLLGEQACAVNPSVQR
jgi:predicted DCC family thiol-disulfide oxidoreductase YuxK